MYILSDVGVINVDEEYCKDLSLTDKYDEILEGNFLIIEGDRLEFYLNNLNKDLSVENIYYMTLPSNESYNEKVRIKRERLYKAESDSIYMSFIKYSALGQDDKAKEAYDQWLAKVKQIEEENPYIE